MEQPAVLPLIRGIVIHMTARDPARRDRSVFGFPPCVRVQGQRPSRTLCHPAGATFGQNVDMKYALVGLEGGNASHTSRKPLHSSEFRPTSLSFRDSSALSSAVAGCVFRACVFKLLVSVAPRGFLWAREQATPRCVFQRPPVLCTAAPPHAGRAITLPYTQ